MSHRHLLVVVKIGLVLWFAQAEMVLCIDSIIALSYLVFQIDIRRSIVDIMSANKVIII